jgi:membrane-associated protein
MLDFIQDAFRTLYNVEAVVRYGGTLIVCVFVFIETGLFVGFFLPGDSLLVTAGVFAAAGLVDLPALLLFATICAVAGDQTGFWIGRALGQRLYKKEDSFFFRRSHLMKAHDFYEKYGPKTIVLARFIPIIRTFAPAVAGAAGMNYRKFVTYNVLGGILWVEGVVLAGYFLGRSIPNIGKHIHLVIAAVIFLSFLPIVYELWKARSRRKGG